MKNLLLTLVLMPMMALADTETVNGITWTYTVSDGQASVGGGNSSTLAVPKTTTGAITIPDVLGGCPVTGIAPCAFDYCDELTSVEIPSSVTSIGANAFESCRRLKAVELAEGVISIGAAAFSGCYELDLISIPSSVTRVGARAFEGTQKLMREGYSSYFKIIDHWLIAYSGGNSVTVAIPEGVCAIADAAFINCKEMSSVLIPQSIVNIGESVFWGCDRLAWITVDSNNRYFSSKNGILYDKAMEKLICCP